MDIEEEVAKLCDCAIKNGFPNVPEETRLLWRELILLKKETPRNIRIFIYEEGRKKKGKLSREEKVFLILLFDRMGSLEEECDNIPLDPYEYYDLENGNYYKMEETIN